MGTTILKYAAKYSSLLKTNPYATKMITASSLGGVADILV